MKEINKSNTVQAFWVALGTLSTFGLSIVSAAILSRYFDKAEYGTYKQILYVYGSLLIVFTGGLPRVFAYFLPRHNISEGKAIIWKVSKLLFFCGVGFSLFLFISSDLIAKFLNNEQLAYALKVFSPVPMLLLPTLGLEGILSTYKKTMYLAVYNTLSRLFMLASIVTPVIFFGGTVITAIYGWIISSFIILILAVYFKTLPFRDVESLPSHLSFKEIFTYSIPLVTASLWGMAIKAADQFYISHYFGSEVFAEYSNGFIELPFVSMITASTAVVLMPVFSKIVHEGNQTNELLVIWKSAILKSATLIYPMVVFAIFFSNDLMGLLYSSQYESSGVYFKINLILNFFNIVIFAPLIFSLGETKFYTNLHVLIAVLIWLGGYLVLKVFNSPIAIAVLSVSLNIFKILLAMKFVSKKLEVRLLNLFPLKKLLVVFTHNCIAISIIMFFLNYVDSLKIVLKLMICGILYVSILLSTSRLFKINYFYSLTPIIAKVKNGFKFNRISK